MNNRQKKRNQHYVPQSYLRRFTIKGEQSLLWSFDKESKKYLRHPSSVKKVCCEDYYYYQLDDAGEVNHIDLEDSISEVEKIGNDIINKILNMRAMPYVYLSIEDKSYLAYYIAFMQTRGPAFRNIVNDVWGDIAVRTLKSSFDAKIFPEPPEVLQRMIDEKGLLEAVRLSIHSSVSLEYMIEFARQLAQVFLNKQWTLHISSNDFEFVSSDNPVSFFSKSNASGIGPGHPSAITIFPISPRVCLSIEPAQRPDLEINIERCEAFVQLKINQLIFDGANELIFSSSKQDWVESYCKENQGSKALSINSGLKKEFEIIKNPFKK
ncbi:hypothetical protein M2403_004659 [Rahnella sp. BIGb0603]|nr:hypothetical protein [Rahnella sp. BIGb0603]